MPTLHLIRHGKAAAGWDEAVDPGLDALGARQAEATARVLADTLQPMPLYTSPLRRCRETARPLERLWSRDATLFEAVAELPSPPLDLRARHAWLMASMQGTWRELQAHAPPGSPDYLAWRRSLLDALLGLPEDAVVFSHYIAINAVVGAARGSDAVVCFRPDHASITRVDVAAGGFRVVALGRESDTTVLVRR